MEMVVTECERRSSIDGPRVCQQKCDAMDACKAFTVDDTGACHLRSGDIISDQGLIRGRFDSGAQTHIKVELTNQAAATCAYNMHGNNQWP